MQSVQKRTGQLTVAGPNSWLPNRVLDRPLMIVLCHWRGMLVRLVHGAWYIHMPNTAKYLSSLSKSVQGSQLELLTHRRNSLGDNEMNMQLALEPAAAW